MATGKKKAVGASAPAGATEDDLDRLVKALQKTYEKLREVDEDDLPPGRAQEYWRDRYFARAAWEHAELAAFENLVDQQRQQLPALADSNAKLAKDAQSTADAMALLDVVSASLGVLASVIALLA